MCGIAGFVARSSVSEQLAIDPVRRMTERMARRGPDAEGSWVGPGAVLGHRRLAILDLDRRANQPMISADGRYVICFNGEIYNFRELRQGLQQSGVGFRTSSDTEVLLALYAEEGARMLPRLRGMFALAIWDTHSRELFLARDPYGIKPLYYAETDRGLVFASQVKALLASGLVAREPEAAGWVGFYLWGSVPEPWTIYRNVRALAAGHYLRIGAAATPAPVCWHDIREHWQEAARSASASELQEKVRQAVRDSVRAHLVADVPVSVFLSGGIDSATIAALATELGAQVEGITVGFQEFAGRHDDEVPMAQTIAAHYGLPLHVRMVGRAEFDEDLPRIIDAMDQPSIDGVNTWFASKAAAERGYKVVLSGVGGDELFCGYASFRQLPRQAALLRALAAIPGARTLANGPCAYLAKRRRQPKFAAVPAYMDSLEGAYFLNRSLFLPTELPALLPAEFVRDGLARLGGTPPGMRPAQARDGLAAVGLLESIHYLRNQLLRDSDWASMGHSLELRTPLVDGALLARLAPYVAGFVGGAGKSMLAQAPKKPLPAAVVKRVKTGFGLPMADWLARRDEPNRGAKVSAPKEPWARRWAQTLAAPAF